MAAKQELFDAIYRNDMPAARAVWRENELSANIKDSATGIGGTSVLSYAVMQQDIDFANELIASGADVNGRGEDGMTPMFMATSAAGVELLRSFNADPNIPLTRSGERFSRGAVAMHRAAASGDPQLVAALLRAGGDARAADRDGVTPLHYAARSDEEVVRVLVRAGADLDATDRYGNTPRQALERAFPNFQMEVGMAQVTEVARDEQIATDLDVAEGANAVEHGNVARAVDGLSGYDYVLGKELKTQEGDYFYTAGDRLQASRLAFLPTTGSLDGLAEFESPDALKVHLAQRSPADRQAVEAFYARSEELHRPQKGVVRAGNGGESLEPAAPGVNEAPSAREGKPASDVENAIMPAPALDAAAGLAERMANANWYYAYLEDATQRAAGREAAEAILQDLTTFAKTDAKRAAELWASHGPKTISPPAYLRDAMGGAAALEPIQPVNQAGQEAVEAARKRAAEERAAQEAEGSSVENAIQPAPGQAMRPAVGQTAAEDAFVRAPGTDARSGQIGPSGEHAAATPAKDGPATLLAGRFVRGENGEYRRQGESRVALFDEAEKIRFVDKQMDAFQAAVELAKHKEWNAILVTGTEKFRSEAWYHASLAGLQVVGYEPSEKEKETLRAAQERAAQSNGEPARDANLAGRAGATEKSLKEANEFALKSVGVTQPLNVQSGRYAGKVLHETDHHVVQDVGKKVAVVHEKSRFNTADLKKAIERGGSLRVQYDQGKAAIDAGKSRSHAQSR